MCEDQKQRIWLKCKKELFEYDRSPKCPPPSDDRVLTVPSFDTGGDWPDFLERLQNYFKDYNIKGDRRVAVLLTCINQSVYSEIEKACKPDQPNKKTYKHLISLIEKLSSKNNVWRERIKFFKLKQGRERAGEWLNRILEVARLCEFGESMEEHVRNKFVCGLRCGPVLDGLCEEEFNKSSDELLNAALTIEKSIPDTCLQPLKSVNNSFIKLHSSPFPLRQSPRRLAAVSKENYWTAQAKPTSYAQHYLNSLYSRDKRGTKRPHNGGDDDDAPAPTCLCGLSAKKCTVWKEGPNQGRDFFICPNDVDKCSIFTWADEVQININCFCQLTAKKMKVRKEGPNQNRQFFACPKPHGDNGRCQFFVWADEAESGGSGRDREPSAGSARRTYGNSSYSRPTSAKKSKTTNSKTKTSSAYRASGGKETKTRKCGVCGQPGHNRKNCPQNE